MQIWQRIIQSTGSSLSPCTSTIIIGAVQLASNVISTLIVEKFGRKILLIISDLSTFVSMIGVGVFFKLKENCSECDQTQLVPSLEVYVSKNTVDELGWLPLLSLIVFNFGFFIGLAGLPWVLNVELMPPEARVSDPKNLT